MPPESAPVASGDGGGGNFLTRDDNYRLDARMIERALKQWDVPEALVATLVPGLAMIFADKSADYRARVAASRAIIAAVSQNQKAAEIALHIESERHRRANPDASPSVNVTVNTQVNNLTQMLEGATNEELKAMEEQLKAIVARQSPPAIQAPVVIDAPPAPPPSTNGYHEPGKNGTP